MSLEATSSEALLTTRRVILRAMWSRRYSNLLLALLLIIVGAIIAAIAPPAGVAMAIGGLLLFTAACAGLFDNHLALIDEIRWWLVAQDHYDLRTLAAISFYARSQPETPPNTIMREAVERAIYSRRRWQRS